eukprot:scaffold44057_cov59-Attheya_sp.AAC.3
MEDIGRKVMTNTSVTNESKIIEDDVNIGRESYELTEGIHRENTWLAYDAVFVIKPGKTKEERKIANPICVDKAIKEEETRLHEKAERNTKAVKHDKECCKICKQEAVKEEKEERIRCLEEIWCMEVEGDIMPGMCVSNW